MNSSTWRRGILGALAVATISVGVIGCGDDTTNNQDMAAPDLSASPRDMSKAPPDMTGQKTDGGMMTMEGAGLMTIADVVGNIWVPNGAGGEVNPPNLQFVHLLSTQTGFPETAAKDDYVDSDQLLVPGMIHGCTADRYDFTTGKVPPPSIDAGRVTYTGYNTMTLGSTQTGTTAPPSPNIVCAFGGASAPFYNCFYGAPGADGGTMSLDGTPAGAVSYPRVSLANWTAAGYTVGSCDQTKTTGLCEQHPIVTGMTATITEDLQGGGSYPMHITQMIPQIPDNITIVSIKLGTATFTTLDQITGIDGTKDLVIQWSCDGSNTPGAGCPDPAASGQFDLISMFAQTSQTARSAFSPPGMGTTKFGSISCLEQSGKKAGSPGGGAGTLTIKAAALATALGTPKQSGGSVLFGVVRVKANPTFEGAHPVFALAGHGSFGFSNLP